MALSYVPPGVTIRELTSPSISPLLAVPASICLVGYARGYETATATVIFTAEGGAKTFTLPVGYNFQAVDVGESFQSFTNAVDPTETYAETVDYTVSYDSATRTVTITPVNATDLDTNGATINIVYRRLDDKYFVPTKLDSFSAVEARFGPAFDNITNSIVTPLSYAAGLAFENGANEVIISPLFKLTTPGDPNSIRLQPSEAEAIELAQWVSTFYAMRDYEDINIVVPVIGQSLSGVTNARQLEIFQALQDHLKFMSAQYQYIIAILGEDGTGTTDVLATDIRGHAETLRGRYAGEMNEQICLISPANFGRPSSGSATLNLAVGGQYVAASIAGMLAARPVFSPITRKQVVGFNSVNDPRSLGDKNADASTGLFVTEQRGTSVQVRHAITLNNDSTAQRELSVVRAKHRMIESIRDTLEAQVIGQVPADNNAPLVVRSAIGSVLEALRTEKSIVEYNDLEARTLTLDPTTVEVRFSYRPAFPLNYIIVQFSIDLTTGNLSTEFGATAL